MSTSASAMTHTRRASSTLSGWPALLVSVIVFAAAVYSFSPRPQPPFPATAVEPHELLITGVARSGSRFVAVGEQGRIMIADAAAGPWREVTLKPQRGSTFTQVAFVDQNLVLAVGHDGWIVRSEDGGESWKEAAFDAGRSEPLLGLAGPYENKLFAFGAFGQFLSSADRGLTWQRETHAAMSDRHLNAMTRAKHGVLLLVGERGLMLRSADGGHTWTLLPEIYAGSFYGALSLPGGELLVHGMRGNVFVSPDGGTSWQRSVVPEAVSLYGGAVTDQGGVVLVGENNSVMVSKDRGATFTLLSQGDRQRLAAVIPLTEGEWLTAGEAGIGIRRANSSGDPS